VTNTRAQIESLLEQTGALRRGHFVLSSGLHSDRYCQCAALFTQPDIARRVARLMADDMATAPVPDVVLAPALGGMLWGYELARQLGVRTLFAERSRDGQFALRRGFAIEPGEKVLLAEDVVTTGGSVMELVPLCEDAGASVSGIAVLVDRSGGSFQPNVPLHSLIELDIPTWPADALPDHLQGVAVDRPGSRKAAAPGEQRI